MANDTKLRHAYIRVIGRVQGVYYRASAVQAAQTFGVNGWVRNESDGSVAIHGEGSHEQLEQLIGWCWQGPAGARVDQVNVEWLNHIQGFRGFTIRR